MMLRRHCTLPGSRHAISINHEQEIVTAMGWNKSRETYARFMMKRFVVHDAAWQLIRTAIVERVRKAQSEGDVASNLDPSEIAGFLSASFAGIRIAARGGANTRQLRALGRFALRALQ